MHLYRRGVEFANSSPEILALGLDDVSNPIRLIGGVLAGVSLLGLLIKGSFKKVPEGYVGIRTFNERALDENGEPLHELLEPGGHWMLPGLHDVELINRQRQTVVIETTTDLLHPDGFTQFKIGAIATWGVMTTPSGIRPRVDFTDAYKQFYGIDSFEDLEAIVAGVATRYLIDCVQELPLDGRTIDVLEEYAVDNLPTICNLAQYGTEIHDFQITDFSRAGVIQFGSNS